MNKLRRKALDALIERIDDIYSEPEALADEERDYRDNMPENLQNSERYEAADNAVSSLEDALDNLDSAKSSIEEAIDG